MGKSTLANKYVRKGYYLLSFDEIIRTELSQNYKNIDIKNLFKLYRAEHNDPTTTELKDAFVKLVKTKMKEHPKIVAESGIRDLDLIKRIFGDDFTFYYVKPKSLRILYKRRYKRFLEDPNNYSRLGAIRVLDINGNALQDFKNGDPKKIKELIYRNSKDSFDDIDEQYQYYANNFIVDMLTV